MRITTILFSFLLVISCTSRKRMNTATIYEVKNDLKPFMIEDFFNIRNVRVKESISFMNYSLNMIDDGTESLFFFSAHPFKMGQEISRIKVKYCHLYSDANEDIALLVDVKSSKLIRNSGSLIQGLLLSHLSK